MIEVDDLHKRFGTTQALSGVSFDVETGTVLGLLGPNGAGKTTAVRVLATLLQADRGRARIDGHDVVADADTVRSIIGLTGQYAAVDEKLTGSENLELVGRLLGMRGERARARARELLERFDLAEASDRQVGTYSGGMRRRADLAVSLVGRPRVLFLDEPTTGLDPASRVGLWSIIRELVADGTTVLLTTQYLEEADQLADRIVVIDHGTVIEEGTANELKDRTGSRTLQVQVAEDHELEPARSVLCGLAPPEGVQVDAAIRTISLPVGTDTSLASHAIAGLSDAGIDIVDFHMGRPSLDDVFLSLTGSGTDSPTAGSDDASPGGTP